MTGMAKAQVEKSPIIIIQPARQIYCNIIAYYFYHIVIVIFIILSY